MGWVRLIEKSCTECSSSFYVRPAFKYHTSITGKPVLEYAFPIKYQHDRCASCRRREYIEQTKEFIASQSVTFAQTKSIAEVVESKKKKRQKQTDGVTQRSRMRKEWQMPLVEATGLSNEELARLIWPKRCEDELELRGKKNIVSRVRNGNMAMSDVHFKVIHAVILERLGREMANEALREFNTRVKNKVNYKEQAEELQRSGISTKEAVDIIWPEPLKTSGVGGRFASVMKMFKGQRIAPDSLMEEARRRANAH